MRSNGSEMPEARAEIEVPFFDVDSMNVVWHGNYLKYFEIARCLLLDGISYGYREMRDSGFAWPVIDVRVRYIQPLHLHQRVFVRARLVEYEIRLKIDYLITDAESGRRLTRGHTVQVAIDMAKREMLFTSPPILRQKLGLHP